MDARQAWRPAGRGTPLTRDSSEEVKKDRAENRPAEAPPAVCTEANFDKLKWNMTKAEVLALLGPAQQITGGMVFDRKPASSYSWHQENNYITAYFQEDKLYQAVANLNGKLIEIRQKPLDLPDSKLPTGPSKLTEANFRRVRPKMSQAEVRAIFGPPQYDFSGDTWLDARGNKVQVLYIDGKVSLATATINGKNLSMNPAP